MEQFLVFGVHSCYPAVEGTFSCISHHHFFFIVPVHEIPDAFNHVICGFGTAASALLFSLSPLSRPQVLERSEIGCFFQRHCPRNSRSLKFKLNFWTPMSKRHFFSDISVVSGSPASDIFRQFLNPVTDHFQFTGFLVGRGPYLRSIALV